MKTKTMVNNQQGFTLIEIIAVLVILGILAAVAVPKYLDMTTEAKEQAALGQIAEMKASLNMAYHRYFMTNQVAPTAAQVITELGETSGAAFDVGVAPDIWNVTLTASGTTITIAVNSRNGDASYSESKDWNIPQ